MILSSELIDRIKGHIIEVDYITLFKGYTWNRDNWIDGFPDILGLELLFNEAVKRNLLTKDLILLVAKWGKLNNLSVVKCPSSFQLDTKNNDTYNFIHDDTTIVFILKHIQATIQGFGPTYLSKVLRFAFPLFAGAIDTRLVRVFGLGDIKSNKMNWLNLYVRTDGQRWHIPKTQARWPLEYGKWVSILSFISDQLNSKSIKCPHPAGFIEKGLRKNGLWACADVEMALFSYATEHIR